MNTACHDTLSPIPTFAAIGVFDGVHQGHRLVIERVKIEAAKRGLASGVISFGIHPQQVLHPERRFSLLTSPEERGHLLRQMGVERVIFLDFSPEMSRLSAYDFLKVLSSQYGIKGLIIGYDHRFGHNRAEGFEQYVEYGKELEIEIIRSEELTTTDGAVSSSIIRQLLSHGDVVTANRLLSSPYTLHGQVITGYQVGRTIGFPTANLRIGYPHKLIPANGVYATRILLRDGRTYGGMLNIGNRPTLNRPQDYSIEAHLFDFSGNLYHQELAIELIEYVRTEQSFPNVESLRQQITRDQLRIQQILTEYTK